MKKRKLLVVWLVVALGVSSASVAAALITGSTGSVIRLSAAPPSVKLNALESASSVQAFDERQSYTLTTALAVDAVNPGSYTTFPNGTATIPAGTVVDSHLIHSDIPSKNYTSHRTGSLTFSDNIVGVIASTARLAASDGLGAPGTLYAGTTTWRGLESGSENGSNFSDKFTISADHRTLTFDLQTLVMDEIRVLTRPSLTTTITDTPDPVQAGSDVTYTITVSNHGSAAVAGVQLQDEFPGATLVSATGPTPGACSGATSPITCALGSIAAGSSAVVTVVATSPSTVPGSGNIVNTATSPPGLNPVSATTSVVSPTLNTTIVDAPDPVTVGNDVQYTLTVTNNGIAPVANAHVLDTLPAGTTLKSAPGSCSGTAPVDCALGALAVGAHATVQIVVTTPSAAGPITDAAVATPGTNPQQTENTSVIVSPPNETRGFVSPGGSLTTGGPDPATLSLPADSGTGAGGGAAVLITQGSGSFCDGPCDGTTTTINDFAGYTDPSHPITALLTYTFPASSPTSLPDAADAYASTIYKNDNNPLDPTAGTPIPACTTQGAGVAVPAPCIDGHTITQPSLNNFVVTFTIRYLTGDPGIGKRR